jgi:hypothetical protein
VDHCEAPDFKAQEEERIPMPNLGVSPVMKPTDITTGKSKVAKQSMRNTVRRITYINLIKINQINLCFNTKCKSVNAGNQMGQSGTMLIRIKPVFAKKYIVMDQPTARLRANKHAFLTIEEHCFLWSVHGLLLCSTR